MSLISEEKDRAFREWKERLLDRCEDFIIDHPESKNCNCRKIEIVPSSSLKRVWHVNIDGSLYASFMGDNSRERAEMCARDLQDSNGL